MKEKKSRVRRVHSPAIVLLMQLSCQSICVRGVVGRGYHAQDAIITNNANSIFLSAFGPMIFFVFFDRKKYILLRCIPFVTLFSTEILHDSGIFAPVHAMFSP